MAFFARNWRVMCVGLVLGGVMELLLVRGGFYEQMRRARGQHLDKDWSELDDDGKRLVLQVEERYRRVVGEKS